MERVQLIDVYFCQNALIKEYLDIYFETTAGVLKHNITCLNISQVENFNSYQRLVFIDEMKEKYGHLIIDDVRKTYDNDMYLLISSKWILAIEYVLNSESEQSIQEFRYIEDLQGKNSYELEAFESLERIILPF